MLDLCDDVVFTESINGCVLAVAPLDHGVAALVNILHMAQPIVDESE
jgi:hypothetical protein